jgi:hypothetical protein
VITVKREIPKSESFTFRVIDYDHRRKIYILKNPKTGEVRKITRDDYELYLKEQPSIKSLAGKEYAKHVIRGA